MHIYNDDQAFATELKNVCPPLGKDHQLLVPLDFETPNKFDNQYFTNLIN